MDESSADTPKSILNRIAKIIGLIAIISGIFGVSYQKGMIVKMQLGNLNGNYDVREIINSAIFGYLELFDKVSKIHVFDLMSANWGISIVFLLIGLFVPFLYSKRHNLDGYRESTKQRVRDIIDRVASSYIWSPLVGAVIGFFANLVLSVFFYSMFMLTGVLLLPALLGYLLGASKIDSVMDKPPCTFVTDETLEKKFIRQCTHLKINGIIVKGDILLENSDAYFLHLNESFFYIKKDGKVCISSKFKLREEVKDVKKFEFQKDQSDRFCNETDTTYSDPS